MNSDERLTPSNISEIMEKMNESLRSFAIKETEWIIQKNAYETRISELEGENQAHEQINIDLIKRIKMLEYTLVQERNKNPSSNNNNHSYNINEIIDKKQLINEEALIKIKEKAIRPSLLTMLNEIGINENFANELFTNLELNKTELERLIKKDIEERTSNLHEKIIENRKNNNNNSEINLTNIVFTKQ